MTRYPGILLSTAALALVGCGGGKPPGPPVQSAIPPADTAQRDSAAATDASAPSAVYGDVQLPVAGEVLGTVIHTQDADELQYIVLQKLTDRYAAEKGIDVTDAEKAAYIAHMRAALSKDPNYSGPLPGSEESAEDKAARDEIAAAFIRQWKINRALYQQYGGRIVFQQGGPEPLDAYRKYPGRERGAGRLPDHEPGSGRGLLALLSRRFNSRVLQAWQRGRGEGVRRSAMACRLAFGNQRAFMLTYGVFGPGGNGSGDGNRTHVSSLGTASVRSWPRPDFPGGHRKQTLAGRAISLKVSFLAAPRTHTGGQERAPGVIARRQRCCAAGVRADRPAHARSCEGVGGIDA